MDTLASVGRRARQGTVRGWPVLAALMGVVVLVAGCGSGSGSGSAKVTGSSRSATAGHPPSTSTTTTVPAHHVGEPVTLSGPGGLSVIVQLATVVDPATAAASYDQPGPGLRYVAVRLAVNDIGPIPLTTDLLTDVALDDGAGPAVTPIVLDMSDCPVDFGGVLALASHGPVSIGCVAFEIPTAAAVKGLRVTVAAGPGGQATWSVP